MDYQDRLNFIKSKIDKTEDKQKLNDFLDSIKTSDLKPVDKARFIDDINIKLTGKRDISVKAMNLILESRADISDIK